MSDMRPTDPRWDTKTDAELAKALASAQMLAASWTVSALCRRARDRAQAILAEMERRHGQ